VPNAENVSDAPNELVALRSFVRAHAAPDPRTGRREPIWYLPFHGDLMHHAFDQDKPDVDAALIEEMHGHGLITIDYSGNNNWKLAPTAFGRHIVEEEDRSLGTAQVDVSEIIAALEGERAAGNQLGWPVVRPFLAALRAYWGATGYPEYGIPLVPIARSLRDDLHALFGASVRGLVEDGYLSKGQLGGVVVDGDRRETSFPGEVALTGKAHAVLDGWPGAAPSELVENLLAVLAATAAAEPNPQRKRRVEAVGSAVRELGVSVTSEVLAKVLTGGAL
jgi:hypothetical protein